MYAMQCKIFDDQLNDKQGKRKGKKIIFVLEQSDCLIWSMKQYKCSRLRETSEEVVLSLLFRLNTLIDLYDQI